MARPHRKRDYKAEYQRRIQRGLARGFSRSQARGHARRDEFGIRERQQIQAGTASESLYEKLRDKSLRNRREGKEFRGLQDWFGDTAFPDNLLDGLDHETRDFIFGY